METQQPIRPITREELSHMALPVDFDASKIKNKALNVPYGTLPEQLLDVYLPDAPAGPCPVIFYIHGGGWTLGTKTHGALDCIIGALDRGFAVLSIDYRLAPGATFPAFIYDAKTAVRWARANWEKYGFDPARFAAVGDSAGGYIALMLALTGGMPQYEGEVYGHAGQSSRIQAACAMYAPSVLDADEDAWYRQSGASRMYIADAEGRGMYETAFGTTDKDLLHFMSPVAHVAADMPPVLLLHGRQDSLVPYQHSEALARRIQALCPPDRVRLCLYEARNHSDKQFMTAENCRQITDFFLAKL